MATSIMFRGTGIAATLGAWAAPCRGQLPPPARGPNLPHLRGSFTRPPPYSRPAPGLAAFAITAPFMGSWRKRVASLQQNRPLNFLVKFGVVFSSVYHMAGGLRHLAWDAVRLHDAKSILTSGRAAVGVSVLAGLRYGLYEHDPESD